MPEKLAIPYGELASYSPDGIALAYITKITENYPFKRYRGGLSSDVLIYDFENNQVAISPIAWPLKENQPGWVKSCSSCQTGVRTCG